MQPCRSVRIFVYVCILLCSKEQTSAGLAPKPRVIQYSLTQWGHRDGLPSTTIYAIVQTTNGFLWLGTADGLIRFDGIRFLQVPLLSSGDMAFGKVRALAASRDGTLWVGTESGMLVRINDNAMKSMTLNLPISSIRERADSLIDVEASNTLIRISPATMHVTHTCQLGSVSAPGSEPHLSPSMPAMRDLSGRCDLDPNFAISPLVLGRAHLTPNQIRSVLRDSDGSQWIATRESGVIHIPSNSEDALPEFEQISVTDGLSSDSVWSIFEDREHNFWIGTQNGLNRLRYDKFSTLTRRTGLLSDNIDSLAVIGNQVFAGSVVGLNTVTASGPQSFLHGSILSLAAGADGTLLAGTPRGLMISKDGRIRIAELGIQAVKITSIAQSSVGEVWFYDQQEGPFRWRKGHEAVKVNVPELQNAVSVIRADARGDVWFGLNTGEIVLYNGAVFRTFASSDHLPGGLPHCISVNNDGTVWIASERGLAFYRGGRFVSWSRKNGLPGSRVLWAVQGLGDRLWLGFNTGVASVAIGDLLRAATDPKFFVPYDFYDDGDGLHSNPDLHGSTPVVVLPDGRLWLTTSEGLASINPADIRQNPVPPPVHIVQILVDDANKDALKRIILPPLTRRIEINYTGLSLRDPRKVTFRYRLLNFDSQWHQVSTRRFATYTNLRPGKYRFEVMAANDDGLWSTEPAVLDFILSPAFYQTKWFVALGVAFLLLTIILVVRYRTRSSADRIRLRFEERLHDRVRVAQELHDNLLQDVMGISLQLELADELTPPGTAGKPVLGRALQLSESALAQGRGALTTLRATTFSHQDLLSSLKLAVARLPEKQHRAIRYSIDGEQFQFRAGMGEEIVQIICEALRNALQHTQGLIDIRLSYTLDRFLAVVKDEGQGISRTTLESGVPGHFGLTGMHERAARITALLTIESNLNGTEVRLIVPGRMAYADHKEDIGIWGRLKARWSQGNPRL